MPSRAWSSERHKLGDLQRHESVLRSVFPPAVSDERDQRGDEKPERMNKIVFSLEQDEDGWPPSSSEILWATAEVTNGDQVFEVSSIPFYVLDLAYQDTVIATMLDGRLRFEKIVKRSGNSTYRLILNVGLESDKFLTLWADLEALGCTYESANGVLIAVNVPFGSAHSAYKVFEKGETSGVWGFEEGYYHRQ